MPSMVSFLPIVVVGCIIIATARILAAAWNNPLGRIPGPWYSRFTNLRLKAAVMSGQRIFYVDSLHRKYGPYVRISPTEIAVNDPAGFKRIHSATAGFEKSRWYFDTVFNDRATLFTMTDNKTHAKRRRLLAKGFSKSNLRQSWEQVIRDNIELAVSQMRTEFRAKGTCDVFKWWTLMATDTSTHIMFGECFNTLQHGEVNEYIEILQYAMQGGGIGAELPLVRIVGSRLPFRSARQMFGDGSYLYDFGRVAIKNMKASHGSQNIFANMMAESEKGEYLSEEDVIAEATALIVAGTDTTAVTLTYLVWAVLSRSDLQRAVEEEVGKLKPEFNEADVEQLPLLNAVIEETLRLYGAAPGMLPRMVPEASIPGYNPSGGVELGGYWMPAGTTVTTQSYSLHRDPDYFHNPHEFNIARWLSSTDEKDPMKLTEIGKAVNSPFGAGSRSCLGIHMARAELRLGAAAFFRECPGARLSPSATEKCMEMVNFFLIAPAGHKCEIILR